MPFQHIQIKSTEGFSEFAEQDHVAVEPVMVAVLQADHQVGLRGLLDVVRDTQAQALCLRDRGEGEAVDVLEDVGVHAGAQHGGNRAVMASRSANGTSSVAECASRG